MCVILEYQSASSFRISWSRILKSKISVVHVVALPYILRQLGLALGLHVPTDVELLATLKVPTERFLGVVLAEVHQHLFRLHGGPLVKPGHQHRGGRGPGPRAHQAPGPRVPGPGPGSAGRAPGSRAPGPRPRPGPRAPGPPDAGGRGGRGGGKDDEQNITVPMGRATDPKKRGALSTATGRGPVTHN